MVMDLDSSFDEFTDDKRFIALVVSDNEDDYDSSTDEVSDNESLEATQKANMTPLGVSTSSNLNILNNGSNNNSHIYNGINNGINSGKNSATNSPKVSGSIRSPTTVRSNKDEKKRWSFMSNHSSTSSNDNAKKRWSRLSSFTDSKDKESKREEKEKFVRRVPTQGSGSASSHKRISLDQHSEQTPTSIKRSSTGSSLKQLFGLIALNDDNKENQYHHKKQDNFKVPATTQNRAQPLKGRSNTGVENSPRQRHSSFFGKNELPRRQSSRFNTHSPSISSLSSLTSSSKWKFWQRSGNNTGNNSGKNNTKKNNTNNNNRDRVISRPLSTHSLMGAPADPTTRTKSSFSELHKAIYTNNNNSSFDDNSSSISNSLSKRLSSSNLSLSNLKHRSSQSSLKHKSSQSSLQRFKTRRKSNNMVEEGSISSSGSHPYLPKISLPVVDQMSRDKIRNKLRNSSSLLSLHSSLPIIIKDYDEVLMQQILEYCDVRDELLPDDGYIPPLKNSVKLSTHVFRAQSEGTNVVYKTILLGTLEDVTYSKSMCLHELKMLRLCKGTTGLPHLLKAFVVRERSTSNEAATTHSTMDDKLYLLLIIRDNGSPLSRVKLSTWPQALKIFWQVVTTLYVAETKFGFEHRNLTLDHILVDDHMNVTLCDLKCARAHWTLNHEILFTRLDHPLFFQGGGDYQFEIYSSMRVILSETSWDSYEPRTNLLWLHFLLYKLFYDYGDKLELQGRARLAALAQLLDPNSNARRSVFRRNEIEVKSCGDLLRFK